MRLLRRALLAMTLTRVNYLIFYTRLINMGKIYLRLSLELLLNAIRLKDSLNLLLTRLP